MSTAEDVAGAPPIDPVLEVRESGLSLGVAIAVGITTASPAYSLAAILVGESGLVLVDMAPMALTSLAFLYPNRRDPDYVRGVRGPSVGGRCGGQDLSYAGGRSASRLTPSPRVLTQ